jgi:hypothetical protein
MEQLTTRDVAPAMVDASNIYTHLVVSPALGDDLYHLRSNNTMLAKWFQ